MKKKKFIKPLLALVLAVSLLMLLTLGAFAYSPADLTVFAEAGVSIESGAPETDGSANGALSDGLIGSENEGVSGSENDGVSGTENGNESNTEGENVSAGDGENGDKNEFATIFDTVYNALIENSDKIFSLLSFVASIIIALLYKKRLLPTVEGSFNTVASALTSFKSDTEKEITAQTGSLSAVSTRLRETENVLMSLTDELSRISDELGEGRLDQKEREKMKSVLLLEVEMLYDVFMQSSLPEYQKQSVREKVASMKRALSEDCNNEA